jgi:ring-1,2-phenylacetyl-CoA epoxidase subunit PaaC
MSLPYVLHLADNALVHGQRVAEWCGHGPVLEEDIAMANIGLDHIGQARLLYQHAAQLMGGDATEDSLAYFRNPEEFRNFVLLELPQRTAFAPSTAVPRDYAVTITRNFLYASFMSHVWEALQHSEDQQLAAIAAKASKEVRYHLRHSTDWMLRLGDGTQESHTRMQMALDYLMPYTQEFFTPFQGKTQDVFVFINKFAINTIAFKDLWLSQVSTVVTRASLQMSPSTGHVTAGKDGLHSEHLSYLLAEMQSLARAHPGGKW